MADSLSPRARIVAGLLAAASLSGSTLGQAVSDDGVNWRIVGFIAPDADTPACHVPQALVTQRDGSAWLYLFYACQIGGEPTYDYRYDKIRAMRRPLEPK